MTKNKVTVTDNSIKSGVTSDANKAICEYIWNGFDAHAQHVSIRYTVNEIGTILSLSITDDGDGIKRTTLPETFGRYQDSVKKKSFQWSSQVKGHKGKGRYSFNCFATGAKWSTIFRDDEGHLLQHIISINGDDNDHYNDHSDEGEARVVHNVSTGTVVSFINVSLSSAFFESLDFINYLQKEFAVFLKLNENRGYSLTVNDKQIDCNAVIAEADSKEITLYDDKLKVNQKFSLTFIRWYEKMKENYSVYYLNEEGLERYEETTRLNKKDTGFHHSVYVSSSYFEYFAPTPKAGEEKSNVEEIVTQMLLEFDGNHPTKSEKDKVFKELRKRVLEWLTEKQKSFITEVGGRELWSRYEAKGVVEMPQNEYEQPLFFELKETIIGIYSVQPKLFTNLGDDQAKALVGCLKLLLQTNKRNDVITILEHIAKMTEEERHKLSLILQTTELSSITNTIDLLQNRLKTVSALKAMVFDTSLNTYEVADIQKRISSAFWLFGEQYNIVTEAEPDFQQALESYLYKISRSKKTKGVSKSKINAEKIKHPDVNKEMDIFAFRQNNHSQKIENIVVELKRPNIQLGEIEVSQIKTYMGLIYNESQFNSPDAQWTFILVGNKFDKSGYIPREINNSKVWGKNNLIQHVDDAGQHYDIYVRTWGSIFDEFEIRHKFLLDKLEMKRKELTVQYNNKKDLHQILQEAEEK